MPHTRKEILSIGREIANKIFHKKEEKVEEVTIKGWAARDELGSLYMYTEKPIKLKENRIWRSVGDMSELTFRQILSSVQWPDEKLTPCTITIKIEK